jgi:prepilin-type processing-associated H-X9-DG protein
MSRDIAKKGTVNADTTLLSILIISGCVILMIWFLMPHIEKPREQTPLVACQCNLRQLGLGMRFYADEYSGAYPTSEKWCDLIKPYFGNTYDKTFRCREAVDANCHYAMNPNCKPKSTTDTVLLFETKGGWNLRGGTELLTFENHKEKICNVLFNDGSVKSIKRDEILNLYWNTEEKK